MRLVSTGRLHTVFEFGALRVVALRDGHIDMPPARLRHEDGCGFDVLPEGVPLVGGNLRLAVNAFHVTDGTRSLLVDTGGSDVWPEPGMGLLHEALDEAGIDRATVTDVAVTHHHEDHVGGLVAPDGTEAFPALERVWIGAGDAAVLTGRLAPFRDRAVPLTAETALNDWATALPAPGHTPGHTVYDIRSTAGHLLVWGDTVHVPTLQFGRPGVTWEYDADRPGARAARLALLERLATPDHYVAGAHLDSPGVARVTPDGDGYALEYLAPPLG
ncbi:MBL fold metallo-hydrolase [Kitasatospora phosalacinea]|uniref:MBL fold metallo-hydrolase n=1 Tax=Kitasatospora phosalacinea TaxID=2065 RepID=A0A9W6Q437_9ACTN|nr:MBL fold metallo-hydrolase [Kitasatospora phosalacinea]GLW67827.1 MBL fold metallo-hydrolase [Kitasatospora phosalacinea]